MLSRSAEFPCKTSGYRTKRGGKIREKKSLKGQKMRHSDTVLSHAVSLLEREISLKNIFILWKILIKPKLQEKSFDCSWLMWDFESPPECLKSQFLKKEISPVS